jgi:uncharacterized Zn-finger protein
MSEPAIAGRALRLFHSVSTRYGVSGAGAVKNMTENIVPHFHNDIGVAAIEIGAKEFMCIGAMPPFDHPHVFCDMGDDDEFVCPYCSTLYRFNPALAPTEARPPECALKSELV